MKTQPKTPPDVSCAGGNAVVQSPGGAAPVQLRHAGGPVERGLHLRRDVQEKVSETSPTVHQAAVLNLHRKDPRGSRGAWPRFIDR